MAQGTGEECLSFLKEAKDALENLQSLETKETECAQKEQQLGRTCTAEKKRMHDVVQQTVKARRDEIHQNYDKETARAQELLKKTRANREKARSQGVKERIKDETAAYYSDIQSHMTQLKSVVKQNRMPFYCGSKLYYSLYFPRHLRELLTVFFFVGVFFVLIPCGSYLCIPNRRAWYLAVIYVAALLVFGGIYLFFGNRSRDRFPEQLKTCRGLLDQAYAAKKKIRRTARSIRRDRDEGHYDLGKYDDEISRLSQELDDVAARKKEALSTYENVTRNIIVDEIETAHRAKLEELSREHDQAEMELKVVRQDLKNRRLQFSDTYGAYLGKEFMDPARVARLCLIVQDGRASSVSEAIERYREDEAKS